MKPSLKNETITIQRLSDQAALNDFDETTENSWEDVEDRWAHIQSHGVKELWQAGQNVSQATHMVTLHSDSVTRTVTVRDRILWGERILRVLNVSDEHNEFHELVIMCREVLGMEPE